MEYLNPDFERTIYPPRYIGSSAGHQLNYTRKNHRNRFGKHIRSSEWKNARRNPKRVKKREANVVEGISYISSNDFSSNDITSNRSTFGYSNLEPLEAENLPFKTFALKPWKQERIKQNMNERHSEHVIQKIETEGLRAGAFPTPNRMLDRVEDPEYPRRYSRQSSHNEISNVRRQSRKEMDGITSKTRDESSQRFDETQSFDCVTSASPGTNDVCIIQDSQTWFGDEVEKNIGNEEMPNWAKMMLARKFSFPEQFKRMKESIKKWSLRIRGFGSFDLGDIRTTEIFYTDESQNALERSGAPNQGQTSRPIKTNNLVMCILGLFLLVVAVFPVISIIYISKDKSEFVKIDIQLKFNSSLDENTNEDALSFSICSEKRVASC